MARARYKELVDSLAADIRIGVLSPGTKLPTHRQLATDHGLAVVTASRVYAELEKMGLVIGETGRGTFVRDVFLPTGLSIDQQVVATGVIDLNFNYPALPDQTELLRTSLRQLASSGDLESLLHYQPHGGRYHEKEIITRYLLQRGLRADAKNLLIVDGAQHGLATTAMALLKPGDVLAIDALTYPGMKVLAEALSIELLPIPVDGECMDINALEKACKSRRVRAVYTQPTIHNPLGWVMTIKQRLDLITIARHQDLIIIEDAPYAFLAENAPSPIAMLAPDITVYISGLSKNIATGLRVGFVVSPPQWIRLIERAIRVTTWNTPAVMTAIACGWVADGTVTRLENEKRRDAMQRQLVVNEVLKTLHRVCHPTSYFVWLPLPKEIRADNVAGDLLAHNISVSTAEPFSVGSNVPQAIRLALGSVDLVTLRLALTQVKTSIEGYAY